MFDQRQLILLAPLEGWVFKRGNDPTWAGEGIPTTDWIKFKPTELSSKLADKNGRAEGWFRLRFKLDNDLSGLGLGIRRGCWAATDIFLDGTLVATFGNLGTSKENFQEYNPIDKSSTPVNLKEGNEHLLAVHFVDYLSPIPPYKLRSETIGGVRLETLNLKSFIMFVGPKHDLIASSFSALTLPYRSVWFSVTCLLALLFWLLAFLNPHERKVLLLIAVNSSFAALSNLTRFFLTDTGISFIGFRLNDSLINLSFWAISITSFSIVLIIFEIKISSYLRRFFIAYAVIGSFSVIFVFFVSFQYINAVIGFFLTASILITSWRKLNGAQWAIVVGIAASVVFGTIGNILTLGNTAADLFFLTCFYFAFPLSLVGYVSLRFKEIIREVEDNARQIVRMTKEREQHAVMQQRLLEEEVARQTIELRTSLEHLKSAQSQLIQSEKMASLGELTAGIAHEIQNPLNFVNNFSEVSTELVDEMNTELASGNWQLATEISQDLKQNLEKINQHGMRAGDIVKGMLQHSRSSSGVKEPTDINALADEYLRLAYHGLRAKDKSFNATTKTDFDPSIGNVNVIPQDIGRVILNLITNAFYAVSERSKSGISGYEPTVVVSTRRSPLLGRGAGGEVEITVKDNGNGIPQKGLDKIFQPFFTTKPTGQGTGLGLSLSYDIVKAHGGELKVETKEGEGSVFVVELSL
jgi:signal transduction histidine kinase